VLHGIERARKHVLVCTAFRRGLYFLRRPTASLHGVATRLPCDSKRQRKLGLHFVTQGTDGADWRCRSRCRGTCGRLKSGRCAPVWYTKPLAHPTAVPERASDVQMRSAQLPSGLISPPSIPPARV